MDPVDGAGEASVHCCGALSSALINRSCMFLLLRPQKGPVKWRDVVCRPSFVSSPLAMSPAWRIEFAVEELPLWCRNSIPSEWNGDMMPFKGAKIQENVVVVLAKLKSSFANQIQRRHVCFLSETRVAALDPSISNGLHHLILDRQKSRCRGILASSLWLHHRQEISFHFLLLTGIKISEWLFWLRRTSLLCALKYRVRSPDACMIRYSHYLESGLDHDMVNSAT